MLGKTCSIFEIIDAVSILRVSYPSLSERMALGVAVSGQCLTLRTVVLTWTEEERIKKIDERERQILPNASKSWTN